MKVKNPKKPFHTIHGDHPCPIAIPPTWLKNDQDAYLHSPTSPDLPGLNEFDTSRWLVNLDGLGDINEPRTRHSPRSRSSSLLLTVPDASSSRPPGRSSPVSPPQCPAYRSTVPKASLHRTRPTLPASFFSSPLRRPNTPQSEKRYPDRFIPERDSPATTPRSEMYRLTKAPCELTNSEMLLRHRGDTPDPFTILPKPPQQGVRQENNEARPTSSSRNTGPTALTPRSTNPNLSSSGGERQASYGSAWSVGGIAPIGGTVNNGHGGLVQSGTNVPLYTASYPTLKGGHNNDNQKHRERLASALDIDRANRVLGMSNKPISSLGYTASPMRRGSMGKKTYWTGHKWERSASTPTKSRKVSETRILPSSPFKVLDAPGLRDDFYCSILAFSPVCNTLAVGLGNTVYGWSEKNGVTCLNAGILGEAESTWITSLAFSSAEGGKSILAVGRSSGKVALLSLFDSMIPRFELVYAHAVTSLAWRPRTSVRTSRSPHNRPGSRVKSEDLLARDEKGRLWYYSVEWPDAWESPDGNLFASGGNDDFCSIFEVKTVLGQDDESVVHDARVEAEKPRADPANARLLRKLFRNTRPAWMSQKVPPPKNTNVVPPLVTIWDKGKTRSASSGTKDLPAAIAKHRWRHGAAVKAIAFCPWRSGLLATGGGSHNKAIHFYHTTTGAALATIAVSAQVTSLIWSKTKREIAACFGYAQPEHPEGEMRALCAVGWPVSEKREHNGKKLPRHKDKSKRSARTDGWEYEGEDSDKENSKIEERIERRSETGARSVGRGAPARTSNSKGHRDVWEGCIVVAASDESVKFHEVWEADNRIAARGPGMLGGSDILEGLEGIDKEGEIIR
ncbi:hypothetical protein MKZ38_003273 [Zalerion maritima]|uniref:Uncharacterized protein n=1 Tax=Zalerion maritima TaxID=339359 RepID=A0AAD5WRZ3_9PEZI|nr:hypothetical protein MKZ38_003273 [Zalerion maritima]